MKLVFAKSVWILVMVAALVSCRRPQQEGTTSAATTPANSSPVMTPGAPSPEELTELLGVPVDAATGEINQYLIRAPQGTADLAKVGTIHADLGYAVGVTLANGTQIGFRYEPPKVETPAEPAPAVEAPTAKQ